MPRINSFNVGDRVEYQHPHGYERVPNGTTGTVWRAEPGAFGVNWDNGYEGQFHNIGYIKPFEEEVVEEDWS